MISMEREKEKKKTKEKGGGPQIYRQNSGSMVRKIC